MPKLPARPQEVLVSMACQKVSRWGSLTLLALVLPGDAGGSCKGPTPLADLTSFLPVCPLESSREPDAFLGSMTEGSPGDDSLSVGWAVAAARCKEKKRKKKKKTDSLSGAHIKVNIKSTKGAKCFSFGRTKDVISSFVVSNLHGFTFVL